MLIERIKTSLLGIILIFGLVYCGAEESPNPDQNPEDRAPTPSSQQHEQDDADALAPKGSDPERRREDSPRSVDIGTPKETGPDDKGKARVYLADAPVDSLHNLIFDLDSILIKNRDGGVTRFLSTAQQMDILQYTGGDLKMIGEIDLPEGDYSALGVLLKQAPVASIENGEIQVQTEALAPLFPSHSNGGISGAENFSINTNEPIDLVLHVDLHKGLVNTPDGELLLKSSQDLYQLGTRGALSVISLPLVDILCLDPAPDDSSALITMELYNPLNLINLLNPLDPLLNSDCPSSVARGVSHEDGFRMAHLRPGRYQPTVFLTNGIVIRLGIPITIEADTTSTLNLTDLIP
jgi:hypothetical protein